MLIRYPLHNNGQYRKLLSRIQRPYKMAKFDKQKYIVYAKYQKASVKALVRVDFTAYALSKHKLLKSKEEKNGQLHKAVILSKK